MKVIISKDYDEMSKRASDLVKSVLLDKPQAKLGLATGSTPIGLYKNLIDLAAKGEIGFQYVKTVNLDEYVGIDPENDQSYQYFMNHNLFDHVNIDKKNTHLPFADKKDPKYLEDYNKLLDDFGQRDIQVLGIGPNGHLAFNEPADRLNKRTSFIDLTESTIKANSRFFEKIEDVPTQAISMGMADIFNSKMLIVLANGKNKHEAVSRILNDDFIETNLPASLLYLHPNSYLFVDEEAVRG